MSSTIPAQAAVTTSTTSTTARIATVAAPTLSPAAVAAAKAARIRVAKLAYFRAVAVRKAMVRAKIVRVARAQVGDRYVSGGSGPNRFDCSGLALYVWKAAGKHLPHYSKAQFNRTKRVSKRSLRPGDLVFFFRHGAHHVAVYIGHGKMVGAANPRKGVRIDYVWRGWYGQRYSGAGRLV